MRFVCLFVVIMVVAILACDSAATNNPVITKPVKDTSTLDWFKNRDLNNTIFINNIVLKDGQEANAGLSFLLQTDSTAVIVSAKHLLGTPAGFKKDLTISEAKKQLASWILRGIDDTVKSMAAGKIIKASGDLLYLQAGDSGYTKNVTLLETSNVDISNIDEPVIHFNNATYKVDNSFYLLGYDSSFNESLYPLELVSQDEAYCVFRAKQPFKIRGLSGGPIVDCKGRVIANLYGSTGKNNEQLIFGNRIY